MFVNLNFLMLNVFCFVFKSQAKTIRGAEVSKLSIIMKFSSPNCPTKSAWFYDISRHFIKCKNLADSWIQHCPTIGKLYTALSDHWIVGHKPVQQFDRWTQHCPTIRHFSRILQTVQRETICPIFYPFSWPLGTALSQAFLKKATSRSNSFEETKHKKLRSKKFKICKDIYWKISLYDMSLKLV